MPDGFPNTRPSAPPRGTLGRLLAFLRSLDPYVGRKWPGEPDFGFCREPGSVEVNAFGCKLILSWGVPSAPHWSADR